MAVTKKGIEVRYPATFYRALGGGGARGFCSPDASNFLQVLSNKAKTEEVYSSIGRTPKERAKAAKTAVEARRYVEEFANDLARLTTRTLEQGWVPPDKIPVCVYPSTGDLSKEAGSETRWKRRGTAAHEQFHAAMRMIEYEHHQSKADRCMREFIDRELADLLPDSKQYGQLKREALSYLSWASALEMTTEEILARVEELRKACLRSPEDCDASSRYFAGQFEQMRRTADAAAGRTPGFRAPLKYAAAGKVPRCTMNELTDAVVQKYGAPTTLALKAARVCGVKRKKP